jgi:hypothetical protein
MTTTSISNLRYRAWQLANKAIDTINNLNDIIYEGSPNKPPKIPNKTEDTSNINLQYIQDGIDLFKSYLYEINHKKNYLNSLHGKNNECKNALTQLIG